MRKSPAILLPILFCASSVVAQDSAETRPTVRSIKKPKHVQMGFLAVLIVVSLSQVACEQEPDEPLFEVFTGTQGCLIEQITSEAYDEFQVQGVSHDGQWLVVGWRNGEDADGNPIQGSYRLNLVTGEKRELGEPLNNSSSFSPDGVWLVGAHYVPDGKTDIFEYNLKTGEATVVAQDSAWDWLPRYSPDGESIVFNSYRSGNSEIYLYDRFEQTLQRLTDYEGYDAHGEFSPDGSQILFHRQVEQRDDGRYDFDLYSYDVASGEETRLTTTPYEESYPSWAPDGQGLVFSSDFEEQTQTNNLYVMNADGSLTQLTDGDWKDRYAYWMRDGSYIYFNSDRSGNEDIYRIEMKGFDCAKAI